MLNTKNKTTKTPPTKGEKCTPNLWQERKKKAMKINAPLKLSAELETHVARTPTHHYTIR